MNFNSFEMFMIVPIDRQPRKAAHRVTCEISCGMPYKSYLGTSWSLSCDSFMVFVHLGYTVISPAFVFVNTQTSQTCLGYAATYTNHVGGYMTKTNGGEVAQQTHRRFCVYTQKPVGDVGVTLYNRLLCLGYTANMLAIVK